MLEFRWLVFLCSPLECWNEFLWVTASVGIDSRLWLFLLVWNTACHNLGWDWGSCLSFSTSSFSDGRIFYLKDILFLLSQHMIWQIFDLQKKSKKSPLKNNLWEAKNATKIVFIFLCSNSFLSGAPPPQPQPQPGGRAWRVCWGGYLGVRVRAGGRRTRPSSPPPVLRLRTPSKTTWGFPR